MINRVTAEKLRRLKEHCHVVPMWGPPHIFEGLLCWCDPVEEEYAHEVLVIHNEPPH